MNNLLNAGLDTCNFRTTTIQFNIHQDISLFFKEIAETKLKKPKTTTNCSMNKLGQYIQHETI